MVKEDGQDLVSIFDIDPTTRMVPQAGFESPIAAHVIAVMNLLRGDPIPQEIQAAVLNHATVNEAGIRNTFDTWGKLLDLPIDKSKKVVFGQLSGQALIVGISLSYGEQFTEFRKRRADFLRASVQMHMVDDELRRAIDGE